MAFDMLGIDLLLSPHEFLFNRNKKKIKCLALLFQFNFIGDKIMNC